MKNPIGQEARYSIYYYDSRGLQRSRLIYSGVVVLKDVYCADGQPETAPVAENYWHVWYGDKPGQFPYTCPIQNKVSARGQGEQAVRSRVGPWLGVLLTACSCGPVESIEIFSPKLRRRAELIVKTEKIN